MTNEEMVSRIAARVLRAQDESPAQQAPAQQAQQAPQEQQAMPQSGPAKNAVKAQLDKVNAAFEAGDEDGFHAALDDLIKNSKHGV